MKAYRNYLRENGKGQRTIDSYLNALEQFKSWSTSENINPTEATHNEMLTYVQDCQLRGNKQQTIKLKLNSLKHYFDYLIQIEQRADNPTEKIAVHGVKRKRMYNLLSIAELETLYNNYPKPNSKTPLSRQLAAQRNKVIIGLMIWQGLGTTELRLLTTKHIHLRAGTIEIPGTRKSNPRELKLQPQQLFDFMDYLQNTLPQLSKLSSTTEQYIFRTSTDKSLYNSLNKMLKQLQNINSSITNFKQIRANVIINWLKQYNLRKVQYMAGHRYVSSTEAYQLNDIEDLKQEITKFHPL